MSIRKGTLTFRDKFLCLLVRKRVSPTQADNFLTWDREIVVGLMVAKLESDFSKLMFAVIHERDCKTSTTYPLHA